MMYRSSSILPAGCAVLGILLALAAALPSPAGAQTPPPPPQLNVFDSRLDALLVKLQTFQSDYASLHNGRYYQALLSHSAVPADGLETNVDRLSFRPTDQAEDLSLLFALTALPDHAPFAFRVDVYAGPNGAGYMVIAQSRIAGQLWERTLNAGPEPWREQGWIKSVIA